MDWSNLQTWAALAALVGVPLAVWTIVAPRFAQSDRLKEAILAALPNGRELPPFDSARDDKNAYLQQHGTDLASLSSAHFADDDALFKALRKLVQTGKVEGGIAQWIINDGPPEALGKTGVLPVFFRRGISPSVRADPNDLVKFIP